MDWILNVPIKFFEYDLKELKERLNNLKGKNILFIGSKRLINSFKLKSTLNILDNGKLKVIDESIVNPDIKLLDKVLNELTFRPELIVSIGGGSSIDLGKAISALYEYKKDLDSVKVLKLLKTKDYLENKNPITIIAVPTTAGTGSECTKWATVWDFDNLKKYSIDADYLYPQESWIVPELTLSLDLKMTLSTGLDALAHAMEAYWAVSSNEYVQWLSSVSITIIRKYLPLVLNKPDNFEFRKQMLMGSFFAGLAFSNTRTTAVHSISYPLTMKFDINHGFAVAVTLFEILKRNWNYINNKNLFLSAWNVENIEDILLWFNNVSKDIQKLNLSSFGVKKKEIPSIVKLATTGGRMDNNPIVFDESEIEDILINCF